MAIEINFDGIVGPTHNYSGLAYGNIASINNQRQISNPKAAALQGLDKMWYLSSLGVPQGIMPPQERPHLPTLRKLGFHGSDAEIIGKLGKSNPELLMAVSSSACMWVANAATLSPSCDSYDAHVHITPANLCTKFHRSIETSMTEKILKLIFDDPLYFTHHPPLPSSSYFGDEGAANHLRLSPQYGHPGLQIFVYGRHAFKPNLFLPQKFPARQSDEACYALARLHELRPNARLFVQQNPRAIDAGAFHCDVVAVSNGPVLFYHEYAFAESRTITERIGMQAEEQCGFSVDFIEVKAQDVPLSDAIDSYLFNSQLITLPNGSMTLIAPEECQRIGSVLRYLEELEKDSTIPIAQVHFVDIRQSMLNGGGPACLRLKAVLNEKELNAVDSRFLLTEKLYLQLKAWINRHYRDKLEPKDLADSQLIVETQQALDDLTRLLQIEPIYEFQLQ